MWRSFRGSCFYFLECDSGYLEVAWRSLCIWNSAVNQNVFWLWVFWINFAWIGEISLYRSCFFFIVLWKFSCFISFNMFLLLWLDFSLQENHLCYIGSSLSWTLSSFFSSLFFSLFFFCSFFLLSLYFLFSSSAFSMFFVIIKSLLI